MFRKNVFFLIVLSYLSTTAFAVNKVSITSGSWNTAGTWSPAGAPGAGDNVTIVAGHVITMNGNQGQCLSLTVNGTADWTSTRTTNVGAGGLLLNNGGALNDNSSTGRLNVAGNFTVTAGASTSLSRLQVVVSGTTFINGTLTFNNAAGNKTFNGDIVVGSGGSWNCTVAENFSFGGSVTNHGTFLASTGVYTLSGNGKSLGGSRNLIFNRVSIGGSYTNTDSVQISTNLAGNGTLTQAANSYLVIGDLTPVNIITASASGNTVKYLVSGNMNTLDITYHHLIIQEVGGTADGTGTYSINGDYSVISGIAQLSNVSIGGNVTISAGSTLNIAGGPFSVTGPTTVSGTLTISSATGTKTFGDVSVSSGGTWNAAVSEDVTITGNLANNGTFTPNTGVYALTGTGKTIAGTLSIPTTSVTGTYTNNGTYTSTTSLGGGGTLSQGVNSVLNVTAGTFTTTVFNASASGNTVSYNFSGAQSVRSPADGSYHHLTLAGTGNKTLAAATDVNGNISIGSVLIANNFNMTVGGNWSSTGTFTPGTNTVTFDGAGQNLGRTGGETFNHLTLSGSGIKSLTSDVVTNGNVTINSTLDVTASSYTIDVNGNWTNNGSFLRNSGTVLFSGTAAQSIGGSALSSFHHLNSANTAGVSLAQNADLYGALTISTGTFTSTGFNFTLKSNASGTARIAAIPGGANFTGNIIMERYTGSGPIDWRFLCSNVGSATIAQWADDFATSGFTGATCGPTDCLTPGCGATCNVPSIYWYDETQGGNLDTFGFMPASNVTDPIVSGRGYWVYLGPNPVTYEVTGSPNKFAQAPTVTYFNSGNIANDGWNLIANPYPSPIDWDAASWTKTNLDNAVYIYNSSTGSYASYVGGVGVNGGSRYIASSQAFWVKSNASSPSISALETVKASPDPTFLKQVWHPNQSGVPMAFKDFPIPQSTNQVPNSLKLTARNSAGKEDEMFIRFTSGATPGFDAASDAWKLAHLDPSLPSISAYVSDSLSLAIAAYPDLQNDTFIYLNFTVQVSGNYSIRRDSMLLLPLSSCLLLEDLATGQVIDLQTNVSYSFSISDTTKAPRFKLRITAPVGKQTIHPVCSNDSSGMAIAQGAGLGPWNYVWKDVQGNPMRSVSGWPGPDTLKNLPAGLFYVDVSSPICGIVTDSFHLKGSSDFIATLNYSDVSCYGYNDGAAWAAVNGGMPPYTYFWNNGATTSAIQNLAPGQYSVTVQDAAACSETHVVLLQQPALLTAGFQASADTVDLSSNNSVAFMNQSSGAQSYTWDYGDGSPIDTSVHPIHYYSTTGTYTTTMVAYQTGCSDTARLPIVVIAGNPLASDGGLASGAISIFSNGDAILLSVGLEYPTDFQVRIYNALGSLMQENLYTGQKQGVIWLPVSHLPAGLCLVEVRAGEFRVTGKAIIR